MTPRRLLPLAAALALACDYRPPSGPIPTHPVSGRVIYKGKPVPDALVGFHRAGGPAPAPPKARPVDVDGTPQPTGKTDAEGNFRLHTYLGDDGAPAGEYRVTVSYAGSAESRNVMAKEASKALNDALPPRYKDPAQSGLTATVKEGENALPPFDLK